MGSGGALELLGICGGRGVGGADYWETLCRLAVGVFGRSGRQGA